MDCISLDGTTYDMDQITSMQLAFDESSGQWKIEVAFAGGGTQYFDMTKENAASVNAWVAHARTFVPRASRALKGPK